MPGQRHDGTTDSSTEEDTFDDETDDEFEEFFELRSDVQDEDEELPNFQWIAAENDNEAQ